jgi:hypothetical protein
MTNAWFRFYNDVINDAKVQLLPKALRWAWVELLCLASKNDGFLPPIEQIAFNVRASVNDAQSDLDALILAGLIDIRADGRLTPHNWADRQFVSDTSRERTRNYRQRLKKRRSDDDVTSQVTAPDPDPDSETDLNYPPSPDAARESEVQKLKNDLGVGRGGEVSIDAKRKVCAKLAIGNADPLVAIYHAWEPSKGALDPDGMFISQAEKFYRDASPDVKAACQPLGPAPPASLPPVQASPQLVASLKGRRHARTV